MDSKHRSGGRSGSMPANPTLQKTFKMITTNLEDISNVQRIAKADLHGSSFRSTANYIPPEIELRSLLQASFLKSRLGQKCNARLVNPVGVLAAIAQVKKQWMAAGTAAEMRQVAAMQTLLLIPPERWEILPNLWAGRKASEKLLPCPASREHSPKLLIKHLALGPVMNQ